jgi:hypothetical protein
VGVLDRLIPISLKTFRTVGKWMIQVVDADLSKHCRMHTYAYIMNGTVQRRFGP